MILKRIKQLYRIFKSILDVISSSEIAAYASSSAFFLFLSIIPMVMLVSGFMSIADIDYGRMVNVSQAVIPERINTFIMQIAYSYSNNVTIMSFSAVITIWLASKGILALIRGLNHINEVEETRNYFVLRFKASVYTLFLLWAIVLSIGVLVFGNTFGDMIAGMLGRKSEWIFLLKLFGMTKHILVALLISVIFCTMYCLLPDNHITDEKSGKERVWQSHYTGAVFTSVFWTVYSFGFSIYIDYFDGFSMYGSLTTIVIVMMWLYFCMYIFFCGALINKWINKEAVT